MGFSDPRWLRSFWPAVALVIVVAVFLGQSLLGLHDPVQPGMNAIPVEDGQLLIEWVMSPGIAWAAGLRPGMSIRPIARPDGTLSTVSYAVTAGKLSGDTVHLDRDWSTLVDVALILVGVEFLAAGVLVFLRASDRAAARRFLLLAGGLAIALVAAPAGATGNTWALYVGWVSQTASVAAFALFFLTVPVRRWKPLHGPFIGVASFLIVVYTYTVLIDPILYDAMRGFVFAFMILGLTVGLAGITWPFLTRSARKDRFLWPVALCCATAIIVFLAGSLIPYVVFDRYLLHPEVAALGMGLLPIGFVWALLSHRLWGMNLGPWAVLRTVFDTIADPIFVVGHNGRLVDASRAGLAMLGMETAKQYAKPFSELASRWETVRSDEMTPTQALLARVFAGETVHGEEQDLHLREGEVVHMSVSGNPISDEQGRVDLAVLVYHDITERKRHEAQLAHLSAHDPLTGLPNRRALQEALSRAVAHAGQEHVSALLFLDVDNFKVVNDTVGHAAGDDTLITLIRLLQEKLRSGDLLARVGGDEFAVLLERTNAEDASAVAGRLRQAVREFSFAYDGHNFNLGLSIGMVLIDSQLDPLAVLARADAAMYRDKGRLTAS